MRGLEDVVRRSAGRPADAAFAAGSVHDPNAAERIAPTLLSDCEPVGTATLGDAMYSDRLMKIHHLEVAGQVAGVSGLSDAVMLERIAARRAELDPLEEELVTWLAGPRGRSRRSSAACGPRLTTEEDGRSVRKRD